MQNAQVKITLASLLCKRRIRKRERERERERVQENESFL